jgi:hypothetical protein
MELDLCRSFLDGEYREIREFLSLIIEISEAFGVFKTIYIEEYFINRWKP